MPQSVNFSLINMQKSIYWDTGLLITGTENFQNHPLATTKECLTSAMSRPFPHMQLLINWRS